MMPRKGISKEEVITTIEGLLAKKEIPTALGIRQALGKGSLTTIQKHFRRWKMESFEKQSGQTKAICEIPIDLKEKEEKLKALKNKVLGLEGQFEALNKELIKKEQDNIRLNKENVNLNQNLEEITKSYKELLVQFETLKDGYEDLKQERERTLQELLTDKNQHIERLTLELKEVNELHLKAIKEVGQRGDELLLQEKVKTISLTDQLKALQSQNKLLTEKLDQEAKAREPLQRELKRQEALIKRFISWKQLQSFSQNPEGHP